MSSSSDDGFGGAAGGGGGGADGAGGSGGFSGNSGSGGSGGASGGSGGGFAGGNGGVGGSSGGGGDGGAGGAGSRGSGAGGGAGEGGAGGSGGGPGEGGAGGSGGGGDGSGGSGNGGGGSDGAHGAGNVGAPPAAQGRSTTPAVKRPPPPPVITTDSPGWVPVADVANQAMAPFQQGPDPSGDVATDVAHWVSHVIKAGTGLLGAVGNALDYGLASGADAISDALGLEALGLSPNGVAMPAMTTFTMHVGPPHSHTHPPSFGAPLLSLGMLLGPGAVTVFIGGAPAARCGDFGIAATCGGFFPPFEIVTGSLNVFIGGSRAARLADLTKHCNKLDPPDPGVKTFVKSGQALDKLGAGLAGAGLAGAVLGGQAHEMAQAAADAAAFAVKAMIGADPGVPPLFGFMAGPLRGNTMIGGIPVPGIGSMVNGAITKGLGKALGKLAGAAKKGLGKLRGQKTKCSGGEPIYLVTGENYGEYLDFSSGSLFEWRRHYTSARRRVDGPLGHGFRHYYQRRLERRLHRATFTDWDGLSVEFSRFELGQDQTVSDGYVLHRLAKGHFRLTRRGQPALEFSGKEFDNELPLTRVVGDSATLDLEYDPLGRLSAIVESPIDVTLERRRFELTYDENSHIRELREVTAAARDPFASPAARQPGIVRAAYTYSDARDLVSAVDGARGRWIGRFDPIHRLVEQTDARGYRYEYRYDANSRCIASSGQDGLWSCKIEYCEGFTRYTEGNATWEYHYNDEGVVTRIVDPYGGEELRTLDDQGRVCLEIDSGGRERHWLYDENGCHFARVDRFGHVFPPEEAAPQVGNPFARTLPRDSLGFLLDGRFERSAQAMLGVHRAVLAPLPSEVAIAAQRCFRLQRPPIEANDDPRRRILPEAPRVRLDPLGRKIEEEDALGRVRAWHYDACGNLVSETDRDGRQTHQEITSWNLVGKRSDALGHAVRYEYSAYERITAIIDPAGNESRYDYDLKNRLVRVRRHGRVREEYEYDSGDHFVRKRDGDGNVLFENTFHENQLVKTRQLASGSLHRIDYDAHGRIIEASTEEHRVTLRYGASGRRMRDLRDGRGVEHRHSADGATTTILGLFKQSDSWNGAGVLTSPAGNTTRIEQREPGFVQRQCANDTVELLQFDEDGRLEASVRYRRGRFGTLALASQRYRYSPEGDLLESHDSERGLTRYRVDAAHRLDSVETPHGAEHSYRLDPAGNLRAHPGSGNIVVGPGNLLDATTEETFQYDRRNHLASRTSRRDQSRVHYTYDAFDMLVRIEREEPPFPSLEHALASAGLPPRPAFHDHPDAVPHCRDWRAAYDALGRRLWTQWTAHDGQRHRRDFYWDGDRLAAEVFPCGRLRIYQYASPTSLAPLQFTDYPSADSPPAAGKTYHAFSNPTGLPLCIEDDQGRTVWYVERADPYGALHLKPRQDIDYSSPATSIEYNLRWPGHYFDPETGLHYNRYRYYDPRLGRYLQSDPLGHEGSPINLYAYCANPVVQVDVLGLDHDGKVAPAPRDHSEDNNGQEGPVTLRGLGKPTSAVDRMLAAFDPGTRDAANRSTTLKRQLDHLEQLQWTIKRGPAGGGSYADKRARVIVVDGDHRGARATGTIAHEVGHATYHDDPYVPPDGLSREQYAAANVQRHLRDEGNAQLNAAQVRDEVSKSGGQDTGIPGAHEAHYQRAYDEYKAGRLSKDEAVQQMGSTIGHEVTSTTGENYRTYYGKSYVDHYDNLYGTA